jgi:hypothetical protein
VSCPAAGAVGRRKGLINGRAGEVMERNTLKREKEKKQPRGNYLPVGELMIWMVLRSVVSNAVTCTGLLNNRAWEAPLSRL